MTRPPHMKLVDPTRPSGEPRLREQSGAVSPHPMSVDRVPSPDAPSYAASSAFLRWEHPDDLSVWTDGVIRDMNAWIYALLSWTRKRD